MAQNENIIYVTLTEDRIDEALGVANEIFVRYAFYRLSRSHNISITL